MIYSSSLDVRRQAGPRALAWARALIRGACSWRGPSDWTEDWTTTRRNAFPGTDRTGWHGEPGHDRLCGRPYGRAGVAPLPTSQALTASLRPCLVHASRF